MTHKDYGLIAKILKDARPVYMPGQSGELPQEYKNRLQGWKGTVQYFGTDLSQDNPRFSCAKFYYECGYTNFYGEVL